jgi:hypothetical protein
MTCTLWSSAAVHLKTAGSSLTNGCVPSVQIFLTTFFTSQPSFYMKVASFVDAPTKCKKFKQTNNKVWLTWLNIITATTIYVSSNTFTQAASPIMAAF